ncbi:MAG: HDOD domain-containing protein [Bacillota bacterium]|jgi:putative nucleotidyltransferase with HDIG domain|nr:HDOD domain-containing protein [Bacillota bacterium]HPZ53519.1 HDOD domain-containing protein [Bacillota bacterium]HQD17080.1 HDOD domain-containing protein [Bacillota bacterium]
MPDSLARQRPQAEQMMNDIFRRVGDLPPLPAVAAKVLEILKDPDADLTALVSIIEKDQALTAKILRVSNSAYYGLVRRISTVKDAVVTLGFNNMRNQVLALSAYSLMQGPASGYALEAGSLWDHSLCTGLCAEHLADTLGYKSIKDEVFIGGLLHDIGKTILSYYVSARFSNILERVDQLGQTFVEAERAELGFDHAEVGARVALRWNLPESLVSMIGDHHKPDLKSVNAARVCLVHVADAIASMLGVGIGVDALEKRLREEAAQLIGLTDHAVQDAMAYMSDLGDLREYIGTH